MIGVGVPQIVEPKVRNARLPACIELGLTGEAEPSPTLGQHTEEILSTILQMTPAEVAGLRAQGII